MENDDNGSQSYKLLCDISQIKPNYEAMIKGGHLKVTETGSIQPGMFRKDSLLFIIIFLT